MIFCSKTPQQCFNTRKAHSVIGNKYFAIIASNAKASGNRSVLLRKSRLNLRQLDCLMRGNYRPEN